MRRDRWIAIATAVSVVLFWQIAISVTGQRAKVPSPFGIASAIAAHIADGSLPSALGDSFLRVLKGFSIAALIGLPIGTAMGMNRWLARAIEPFLDALRSIAPIAWIPIAVLWLGVRGDAAVFIVTYAAVLPLALSAHQAVRLIDHRLLQASQALGAGWSLTLRAVIVPGSIPVLITAVRVSMGFAWGAIIAAELAVGVKIGPGQGSQGIGQMMIETLYVRRDVDTLVMCMLCVGLVSLGIDASARSLGRRLTPWLI